VGTGGAAGNFAAVGGVSSGGTSAGGDVGGANDGAAASSGVLVTSAAGTTGTNGGIGGASDGPVGVVSTSPSYVVFTEGVEYFPSPLMFLDLAGSGEPVQVSLPDKLLGSVALSPSGEFLVYAQDSTPAEDDLLLNEFTPSGYVQGRVVGGFEGRPGFHTAHGFDASGRYAAFSGVAAAGIQGGFDIVDAVANARYFSVDLPLAMAAFDWAPVGNFFTYTAEQSDGNEAFLAELTTTGASDPVALPADILFRHFSADGQRLYYVTKDADGLVDYGYIEPPGDPVVFHQGTVPEPQNFDFYVEPDAESLVVTTSDSGGYFVERLFVDEQKEPERLSDDQPYIIVTSARSGALAVLDYADASGPLGVELLHGSERTPLGTQADADVSTETDFVGDRLIYTLRYSETHLLDVSGSTIDDKVLATAGTWKHCPPSTSTKTKFALVGGGLPGGLRVVDLAHETARDIPASDPAASVLCPVYDQAEDACAYVESSQAGSKIFILHFDAQGMSDPELVYESKEYVALQVVHP
jgi:hypothetical protein